MCVCVRVGISFHTAILNHSTIKTSIFIIIINELIINPFIYKMVINSKLIIKKITKETVKWSYSVVG